MRMDIEVVCRPLADARPAVPRGGRVKGSRRRPVVCRVRAVAARRLSRVRPRWRVPPGSARRTTAVGEQEAQHSEPRESAPRTVPSRQQMSSAVQVSTLLAQAALILKRAAGTKSLVGHSALRTSAGGLDDCSVHARPQFPRTSLTSPSVSPPRRRAKSASHWSRIEYPSARPGRTAPRDAGQVHARVRCPARPSGAARRHQGLSRLDFLGLGRARRLKPKWLAPNTVPNGCPRRCIGDYHRYEPAVVLGGKPPLLV